MLNPFIMHKKTGTRGTSLCRVTKYTWGLLKL